MLLCVGFVCGSYYQGLHEGGLVRSGWPRHLYAGTQFWICTSGHRHIFLQSNIEKEYFHNPICCPYKENWTWLGQFGHSLYCVGVPEEPPELGHQVADGNVPSEARI